MNEKISKIREKSREIQHEIRSRTVGYILTGLGVVVGLAWNDTISAVIQYFFPNEKTTILAKVIYAALLTTVVVIIGIYLSRFAEKKSK